MPIIRPCTFDEAFAARRDACLAVARANAPAQRSQLAQVGTWLDATYSESALDKHQRTRARESARQLNGQIDLGLLVPRSAGGTPRGVRPARSRETNDPRARRLEWAASHMILENKVAGSRRPLGRSHTKETRAMNALRAIVVGAVVTDPAADEWLGSVTELAKCSWDCEADAFPRINGRVRVCEQWGAEALTLMEEAISILEWKAAPASGWRDTSEDRKHMERVRVMNSPEYLWRALRRRPTVLLRPNASRISFTSPKRPNPRLTDLGPLMIERVALVAGKGFLPSRYPRIRTDARDAGSEDWIAWSILPELRTLVAYAELAKDKRVGRIRAALKRATTQSKAFLARRASEAVGLSFDDHARLKALIPHVLESTRADGGKPFADDPADPDRERVNELLGIESPWEIPPKPTSIAQQLVTQLRDRASTDVEILRALEAFHCGETPEAIELRRAVKAATEQFGSPNTMPGVGRRDRTESEDATSAHQARVDEIGEADLPRWASEGLGAPNGGDVSVHPSSKTPKALRPCVRKAGESLDRLCAERDDLIPETGRKPSHKAWEWACENCYGSKPPNYETWCRYVREYFRDRETPGGKRR